MAEHSEIMYVLNDMNKQFVEMKMEMNKRHAKMKAEFKT